MENYFGKDRSYVASYQDMESEGNHVTLRQEDQGKTWHAIAKFAQPEGPCPSSTSPPNGTGKCTWNGFRWINMDSSFNLEFDWQCGCDSKYSTLTQKKDSSTHADKKQKVQGSDDQSHWTGGSDESGDEGDAEGDEVGGEVSNDPAPTTDLSVRKGQMATMLADVQKVYEKAEDDLQEARKAAADEKACLDAKLSQLLKDLEAAKESKEKAENELQQARKSVADEKAHLEAKLSKVKQAMADVFDQ